jgi:hypothetical protein
MPRITHHRRYTANHTWHVDLAGQHLFVKANPHHDQALAEYRGHARLRGFYHVPRLRRMWWAARWTVLAYDRWPHLDTGSGLLLDEITHADLTGCTRRLDSCLTSVFTHYRCVIGDTLERTTSARTVGKLYGDRAAPGGRLDHYYRANRPWPINISSGNLRPADLARTSVVVNGRSHALDFAKLITWLRDYYCTGQVPIWAAVTQGDPTDLNIGWSPAGGPVWFDYDTGGFNALAGEFACFLLYQRLHGAWLTPRYNPAAFRDHPAALRPAVLARPTAATAHDRSSLLIDYQHAPTPARQHVMRRYLDEVVRPVAAHLGVDDLMNWLRPYLVMRLLAVYDLGCLTPQDAALSLALLAEATDPATSLTDSLALTAIHAGAERPPMLTQQGREAE